MKRQISILTFALVIVMGYFVAPVDAERSAAPLLQSGWTTIMSEGFEGAFPSGSWSVFDNDGTTNGEYYWDDDDYNPHTGGWSAWAANGGANQLDPATSNYVNNMKSWMVYGPFDLSNATDAELLFWYWNQSEVNYDYLKWMASVDGTNFYGTSVSGDSVALPLTVVAPFDAT